MQGGGVQEGEGQHDDLQRGGAQEVEGHHDDLWGGGVYEGVVKHDDLQGGRVQEGDGQHYSVHKGEGRDGEVHDGLNINEGDACVMNDDIIVSYDDSEDESFNYDSALEIIFDDSGDSVDFVEEEMENLIDYEDAK